MSLRIRLLLLALISIIAAIYVNVRFVTSEYRDHYKNLLLERGEIASQEVASQINRLLKLGLYIDEFSGFYRQLDEVVKNNNSIQHIAIVHLYGKVLYESTVNEVYSELANKVLNEDTGELLSPDLLSVSVTVGEPPVATIVTFLDQDAIDREISKLESSIYFYAFAAIFLGIALLFILLWSQLDKPVKLLLRNIQETDLKETLQTSTKLLERNDEIGVIARTFESLIKRLSQSQSLMLNTNKKLEEHKKDLEKKVLLRTEELDKMNNELKMDIERRSLLEEKLARMAHTDPMTGLPNRRILEQYIENQIIQAVKNESKFAFLYIDVDDFKKINDEFSHDTGDAALKSLADLFNETKNENEYFARLGGDEFCLVVTNFNSREELEQIANRLIIETAPKVVVSGIRLGISISVGIALFPDNGKCFRELRTESDLAMYNVKRNSKGNYAFA